MGFRVLGFRGLPWDPKTNVLRVLPSNSGVITYFCRVLGLQVNLKP